MAVAAFTGADIDFRSVCKHINVLALGYIMYRAKKQHVNPWLQEVFKGTRDYEQALARQEAAA